VAQRSTTRTPPVTSAGAAFAERSVQWSDIVGHLQFLHDTVLERDAQVVVELGVRSGNSTAALLAAVERTGGHLWSVDIDAPMLPFDSEAWTVIVGDDLAVAEQIPDEIDVLFIDTSHTFVQTLAELRLYGPRARLMLLHDTELEHPDGAPPSPAFPVARAIDTWCAETGCTWENRSGSYGLGVIDREA
jgi:cephalosporin hydroxylase